MSSNEGSLGYNESERAPSVSNEPVHVTQEEMDAQIARLARPPSTPNYHSWPLLTEWTSKQASFVSRVHNVQHNDALAFIRQATTLVDRFPEILDVLRMASNEHVDIDTENERVEADLSDEGCARFAELVQNIRETVDAYSPGLVDGARSPVSRDGLRHRLLSARALDQPLSYRYALDALARQYPEWIELYTKLRRLVMAYLQYLEDLFKRRGWTLEETLLHQPAPVPPPYLQPREYSRFRLFLYTFELHGVNDVARAMDDFLRYRFREPEVVAHLLQAGLFEPRDVHFASARGEAFVTRRSCRKAPKRKLVNVGPAAGN